MRIPRVYADTSVFGGVFDEEFRVPSTTFFDQVRSGRFRLVISPLVEEEIAAAPPGVRALFDEMLTLAEVGIISQEAAQVRQAYLDAGILTPRSRADALHVAQATVSGCDLIVSWNFQHIVHYQRIPMYNAVNTLRGYGQIAIHSPSEVIAIEDEDI
jgi:hypothetical protein